MSRTRLTVLRSLCVLALSASCARNETPAQDFGLSCIDDVRVERTDCGEAVARQRTNRPALSDPADLKIERATAKRLGHMLVLGVELAGPFLSEVDQNVYVFAGAAGSAPSVYRLTGDDAYLSDVGYPVLGSLELPHGYDVRVGVMAPQVSGYTPQVYLEDPVYAHAVGADAGIAQQVDGRLLTITIPLGRHYDERRKPAPERWSVTVATARDYVGFVDQASVLDVGDGETKQAALRQRPAAIYPALNLDAHVFRSASIEAREGGSEIVLETAAPITDWAQTNIHFFFVPVPPYNATFKLPDPSKTASLPYKWSYYCGVYSPRRVFCKASLGSDFTFDKGYAARTALDAPEGVEFRAEPGRYVLSLDPRIARAARAGRPAFAVIVSIGRDGFPPTTWLGLPTP